ncbi:hypothetical protein [Streptomyces sp. NPDC018059]|uniref:hypothetical protein n=1 Tax=Streptomyces sp. NPDC018059 TaxID=3365041 RepID=UPI0037AB46FB
MPAESPSFDSKALTALVERNVDSRPTTELWRCAHLSTVLALELEDGRRIVVKIRPFTERLVGCSQTHRLMWSAGLPCAAPQGEPAVIDGQFVTMESLVEDGTTCDVAPESSARAAAELARFVSIAPAVSAVSSLHPPPPWVWWNHDQGPIWPLPDDLDGDLNEHPGPAWLDEAAQRTRNRLAGHALGAPAVGHCDWEAPNVLWQNGALHAVHDWDSVVAQPEIVIAGTAAAVHAVRGGRAGETAIPHIEQFIRAYQEARELPWTAADREAAWAAGLWVRCFNAKKSTLGPEGNATLARLAPEIEQRLALAGAT